MIDKNHPVTRLANLRDLGGAAGNLGAVKSGLLFRSDDVATIDDAQLSELLDLKLGLIIDFRSKAELESIGRGPLAKEAIDYLHLPLLDYIGEDHNLGSEHLSQEFTNEMLGYWYADVLRKAAPMIAEGVSAIAEHAGPALFHCAIGKDRTGIFASTLYSLLEVDRGHIVRDFARTDANLPQILARLAHSQPFWNEETMRKSGALMRAQPQALEAMFAAVASDGTTITQTMIAAGLSSKSVAQLRIKLVD